MLNLPSMGKSRKFELRREMRTILGRLDERWLKAASGQLCKNLRNLMDQQISREVEHVLVWAAFFPGEPNLTQFVLDQLDKNRVVYLPRMLSDVSMTFISIGKDWFSADPQGGGIPEPEAEAGRQFDVADAERAVVMVPGLAFDRHGGRLGRGKGYYDRFLSLHPQLMKIATCWNFQLVDRVVQDSHDIAMDVICTEQSSEWVIETRKGAQ